MRTNWPDIPFEAWRETCSALHLYIQIVGKYRLARAPWVNHSWHATLYVNACGLTTSLVPDAGGIEIAFDLIRHAVIGRAADGRTAEFPLGPMRVAEFHTQFLETDWQTRRHSAFSRQAQQAAEPCPVPGGPPASAL